VRANLRQIVGSEVDGDALHEMVRQVFSNAGQAYYDHFRAVGQPSEALAKAVRISESVVDQFRSGMAAGRGVLLLGVHMSGFDLSMLALGTYGLPIQVLSLADPQAGFRLLNRLRAEEDIQVTPITPESLRAAVRRLKNGGMVITGIDRPMPEDGELIEFCGRPAYLPVGPARLARMTGAAVYVGCCTYGAGEGYVLNFTGPVEMVCTGGRRQDILVSTRRLAVILEGYVRAHPEQWLMFHPVWPGESATQVVP
jgi:KDO2-lipid IV(A) lauroyltransferase